VESECFDTGDRTLGARATRRGALGLLGVAALAPLVAPGSPGVAAARKRKSAKRKRGNDTRGGLRAETSPNATETLFRDDLIHGFDAASGSGDWFYFAAPGFVGDDGEETTGPHGLRVTAERFGSAVPQETGPNSLAGGVDHVKWLAYANRLTDANVPGFAAERGRELIVEATVSARTFGTENHPFGDAVDDPDDDLRLASAALNGIDFESWMVFDVFLTNKRVYAFYERLPFGRGGPLGNYASFSFQIPLLERRPGDEHKVGIAYDRAAGTVRWLVDGKERFRVDRIGHRIDRKYLTLDHGGKEELVEPKQLDFGMGLFTLLDGRLPSGEALVRLSTAENFYFDPAEGEPTPQTFVDEESLPGSRLFGQGAELRVERFIVESRRA
jgi:hypothetical protein